MGEVASRAGDQRKTKIAQDQEVVIPPLLTLNLCWPLELCINPRKKQEILSFKPEMM